MYPHERSLVEKYKDKPFVIVGVNSDASAEKLAAVIEKEQMTWRSFFDGGGIGGPIATRWGVNGWPTVYVLDAEGVIRSTGGRGETLDKILAELLDPAEEASEEEPASETER